MTEYQVESAASRMQRLVIPMSNSALLANSADLFKQGLALADQLENRMDDDQLPPPSPLRPTCDPLQVSIDPDPQLLSLGDQTILQVDAGDSHPAVAEQSPPARGSSGDTSWTQVWLERGFTKLKQKNFQGAQDNFQRACQKEPHCVEALHGLGIAQYYLANFQGAALSFREAIRLCPTQPALYCNLGTVLYRLGDSLNAVSMFQKAARLDPKDVVAYYGLGIALIHQQAYHKAIAAFRRAIALDHDHANSYYGLGYAQYCLNDLPAAIAALGKAKQRDGRYAPRYEAFLQYCLQSETPSN